MVVLSHQHFLDRMHEFEFSPRITRKQVGTPHDPGMFEGVTLSLPLHRVVLFPNPAAAGEGIWVGNRVGPTRNWTEFYKRVILRRRVTSKPGEPVKVEPAEAVRLLPGQTCIMFTRHKIRLPENVSGEVWMKSGKGARVFLKAHSDAPILQPHRKGDVKRVVLEVRNDGPFPLLLKELDEIVHLRFHSLAHPSPTRKGEWIRPYGKEGFKGVNVTAQERDEMIQTGQIVPIPAGVQTPYFLTHNRSTIGTTQRKRAPQQKPK